ncbi:TetR/AcrR family transcriptional regulator [Pseudooceanicola algae]|uniref:Uncharacterized protein n=1 Tax=Pseudooceanicola algae TaxID=1537215 RepID=A0A418SF63_9RHOB|nr:TetR/AcrR family transcriptional regulator [Pseudooceanicola algae]QPM90199.1 hypothetical protein PSAL_014340 [Pseudooceanicola algae]
MSNWNGEVASRAQIRDQKRRAALRIASRLFNEKGYHATSLEEIAEEIGVTKTALYYYFRNKEELLYECLQVTFTCGEQARAEADALGLDEFETFQAFYKDFVACALRQSGAYLSRPNILALPKGLQQDLTDRKQELVSYITRLLDRAIQDGKLRDVDSDAAANYLISTINWVLSWYTESRETRDPEEVSELFLFQIMNGMAQRN